jgi:SAM-dependent methyltransferase
VVSTLVLCTVRDPDAAVREVRRVLAPGGRLLFTEHVRATSSRLARWQDRLAGPWAAFAQGCRCNVPTDTLLARELRLRRIERDRWRGMPALVHPLIVGEGAA